MRSELHGAAALTAAALLALTAAGDVAGQEAVCGDPIESGQIACPDLSLARSGTPTEDDGELVLVVRVENSGDEGSPSTRVVAAAPGWDDASTEVPALPGPADGPSLTEVELRLAIPDDQRGQVAVFSLVVDPDGAIEEHDEENNDLLVRAPVSEGPAPVPDLQVSAPAHELLDASRAAISATVANVGRRESPATALVVTGAGWEEASAPVEGLGSQGETRVTVELTIPDSARGTTSSLQLTATPVPDEPDTTNNSTSHEVAVPERPRVPNLVLAVTGDRLVDGDNRLALAARVENAGSADAPATRLVAAAPGWQEESVSVPALAAGAAADVAVRLDVPESQRGQRVRLALAVEPVPDEAGTEDNTDSRVVDLPPATPVEDGDDDEDGAGWLVPALVVGAVVLLGLVGLAAWRTRARRDVPEPTPPRPRAEPNLGDAGAAPPPTASLPSGHGWGWRRRPPKPASTPPPPRAPEPESKPKPETETEMEMETEILVPPPARVVNTGFAPAEVPDAPLDPGLPLACGGRYLFWLDVGPPAPRSAERTAIDLPWHLLPPSPELTVALFSLTADGEGFSLDEDADLGSLVVGAAGAVVVGRQPGPTDVPIAATRLLFPLWAPLEEADAQLRCSIYCRGTLVQSRLVTARVRRERVRADGTGFESVLDFTLAPALDPQHLSELPEPALTVMLNRSEATHDFTLFGAGGFKSQASFDVLEVQDLIRSARAGLRRAAWGDEDDWREGVEYLYARGDEPDRLRRDLVELAKRGFRFYASIADRLAADGDAFALSDRLARPASIQIASVESPRQLLPAALLYDYLGFDSTQPAEAYTLCPRFLGALDRDEALEETDCFTGDCESRGQATVVCPSGFWGYRHRLGMPVSVSDAPDSPVAIVYDERGPSVVLAGSTDFELLAAHTEAVTRLCPGLVTATTRADTLRLMREAGVHLLYFYCHGGVQDRVPFIKVGGPDERGITGDLLFSERIRWTAPRPLVFINGCRTTALEPETAIELVSSLVRRAQASGVIGTEITVFEPLARDFAEAYLARFLAGATVGEAVRGARLTLLARGNPLGLAYIPFALESLRLTAAVPA